MQALVRKIGVVWDIAKVGWLVLWPLRFIIGINLVMFAIFFMPQARDALYGAVIAGERPRWLLVAVAFWAVQSWYLARLLLYLPPVGFNRYPYINPGFQSACDARLRVVVPRLLGCLVFILVGAFIRYAAEYPLESHAEGWKWFGLYVVAAIVFYLLTTARRAVRNRPAGMSPLKAMTNLRLGHRIRVAAPASVSPPPAVPPPGPACSAATTLPPLPPHIAKCLAISGWFGLLWLALLVLVMLTAFWRLDEATRLIGSNLVIGALLVGSLIVLWLLPDPPRQKVAITAFVVIDAAVFLLSVNFPAASGMTFGPAVTLMLSAAVWVGATSFFLALPGQQLGLPVTTLLFIGMAVFALIPGWFNGTRGTIDNHILRTSTGAVPADADRLTLLDAFDRWRGCTGGGCPPKKMIIVAVEGGASRAAYWSAMILGALEDTVPDFHQSVFAISAVSGGSLGAAVYQRLVAAGSAGKPKCGDEASYMRCAASILEQDFLGPDLLSMFNSDLLQRLLPGGLLPDRATALESAWERAWKASMRSDDFAAALRLRLKSDLNDPAKWLPVVLLNGASVKTGHRIITSDVALDDTCHTSTVDQRQSPPWDLGSIPSAADFFCLARQPIPLSTAVHNSARFPYISPAGTIWVKDQNGDSWKADRIVDGGYFEVLGGITVTDLLTYLTAKKRLHNVQVMVLAFENDPKDPTLPCASSDGALCEPARKLADRLGREAGAMDLTTKAADDGLAPAIGLENSRTGRGDYAADILEAQVQTHEPHGDFLRFNLLDNPVRDHADPAMSWYLSHRSITDMQRDVCKSDTVGRELDRLGALLPTSTPALANAVRKDLECDKHL